jgi:3-phenylpropionate/trans-cinnamate dioxygenase ferredoxin subunit
VRYEVCDEGELAPGEKRIVQLSSRSVVLVHTPTGYRAFRNVCPHQGAELGLGVLGGTRPPSSVGEFRYEREGEIIRCPWHGWEFDVMCGRSLHDPEGMRVKTYDVIVEEGKVLIET